MTTVTAPRCVCAAHDDGSVTTSACPAHADTDPCLTESWVTGRRRKGTIRRGVCTSCGHTAHRPPAYVTHTMLNYPDPAPAEDFPSAWSQLGTPLVDGAGLEHYGLRGIDGREYVVHRVIGGDSWRVVRNGDYGRGAVTESATLKGAVQRLNAFHVGETCVHCDHVNSTRGHACDACGRIRYARYSSR